VNNRSASAVIDSSTFPFPTNVESIYVTKRKEKEERKVRGGEEEKLSLCKEAELSVSIPYQSSDPWVATGRTPNLDFGGAESESDDITKFWAWWGSFTNILQQTTTTTKHYDVTIIFN
jgi:hypothetical protein